MIGWRNGRFFDSEKVPVYCQNRVGLSGIVRRSMGYLQASSVARSGCNNLYFAVMLFRKMNTGLAGCDWVHCRKGRWAVSNIPV